MRTFWRNTYEQRENDGIDYLIYVYLGKSMFIQIPDKWQLQACVSLADKKFVQIDMRSLFLSD